MSPHYGCSARTERIVRGEPPADTAIATPVTEPPPGRRITKSQLAHERRALSAATGVP
jgi:hypothetical protein